MTFTVVDAPQRSPEWFNARLGRLTSSHANDMLATVKSGESAGRRNLRIKLALERITGRNDDSGFQSTDMQNGCDREAAALALYEAQTGTLLSRSGFLSSTDLQAGWSPDGHTDDFTGFVEVKSPNQATHYDTLTDRKVPTAYVRQMTHAFWISGAAWGDFVSYHPDFPPKLQLVIVRLEARALDLGEYDKAARAFLADVDRDVSIMLGWRVMEVAPIVPTLQLVERK